MRTIHRFTIPYFETTQATFMLPNEWAETVDEAHSGFVVRHIKAEQLPNDVVSVWIELDDSITDMVPVNFELFGTNQAIPRRGAIYHGTAVTNRREDRPSDRLVLHLYELT